MRTLIEDIYWVETEEIPFLRSANFGPFAAIMPFISILGSGLGALGAMNQGKTQAAILQENANVARLQGTMTAQTEKAKQLDLSEQRRKMIGAQIAKYGGAGVDPGVGTPLDVMADTYKQYERDIQYSGYTGEVALTTGQYEASSDEWAAGMAKTSGLLNAGGTLLGGISKPFLTTPGSS